MHIDFDNLSIDKTRQDSLKDMKQRSKNKQTGQRLSSLLAKQLIRNIFYWIQEVSILITIKRQQIYITSIKILKDLYCISSNEKMVETVHEMNENKSLQLHISKYAKYIIRDSEHRTRPTVLAQKKTQK